MFLKNHDTVNFNAANKGHRQAVALFLKRNAWIDSPIRFSYDPTYGSVSEQVQVKLVQYYLDKELNRPKRHTSNIVRSV